MLEAPPRLLLDRRQFLQVLVGATAAEIVGGLAASATAAGELSLEYQVNAYIKRLRRSGRVPPDEHTAWSVYDLMASQKLVSINENQSLQTASMMKPFLAQAYFFRHQEDSHRYPFDKRIRLKMGRMIQHSDNRAANFFIHRVGCDRPVHQRPREVERVLKRYAGDIFLQTSIVEFIPHSGRSYRNKASAHDYSRFLCAMCQNQLPYIRHIKHYMGLPNRNRIKDGTVSVPRCTMLYHKTGTTAHVCGDMGMLVGRDRRGKPYRYTFIGVIQKDSPARDYGGWMRDRGNVIREVSDIVYTFMRKRYNLVG